LPKKQGMVVRHKGKLHMFQDDIFLEVFCDAMSQQKQGIMHRETQYTIQHSVFAFATLPAQFALLMSPFQGCCWNIAIFNTETIHFYT